ncbi:GNAT family N-acetyltransferase [Isoptericola variabilis]|uniref:GCN5-related N-acetyltransferase n=1 Tax=Isoptericola variabilis (strain 225) TaxID=743718 RepID=F6FQ19_ISOV2|nr:GNAT family N-acetyltransferase [Isoptericola variabilis]AEG44825.1 GCN5-related N-acetyltransferase [Isoptericola variabilis 225]TWH31653.1 ribosomal protein S18 acetylase RimI-like enzyme [Isoptericola variabilis J7]
MMVQTDNDVVIRSATPGDAPAIARVHVASWKQAHAGILPPEYLDTLGPESRLEEWTRILSEGRGTTIVAEADGRMLGFASWGPSRDEDAEPGDLELYAIYLDPEAWGRGVARDLMRTVLADVSDGTPMSLWVPATSERARHFYRRHGFHPDGIERIDEVGGTPVTQVRYRRG